MSELPHLFVVADVSVEGNHCRGIAAEGLPPKWFTKNESTSFQEDDLPAMLHVIRHAADTAVDLGARTSVFDWWWPLYQQQHCWAQACNIAPLLAGFGVSLMERAVIDAVCRQQKITFFDAIRDNVFRIDLPVMRSALGPCRLADLLPQKPAPSVRVRHTVGLGDPLIDSDIGSNEATKDGLPHSLVSCIESYGLQYFKIKLAGNDDRDLTRLATIAQILGRQVGPAARFTLDGNEQYSDIETFRASWEHLLDNPQIRTLISQSLLFVEQPLHRSRALDDSVADALRDWPDAPPIIIDESDCDLGSLPTALRLGYAGTSHKNCKGVIKSIAASATIDRQSTNQRRLILSAEDLASVGPVALLQDLAVVSALGIPHVERNGHHYFAGLSMFPREVQRQIVADHGDLYHWHAGNFASALIVDGQMSLRSVNQAPLGIKRIPEHALTEPWEI